MSAVTVSAAVADGKLVIVDENLYRGRIGRACKRWGDGTALTIRIEPEEEAWAHSHVRHLFGHVYGPVLEWGETGYTKTEFHTVMKSFWMPEGKASLTDLSREEMEEYTRLCDKHLREEFPDAFAIHDQMVA